MHVNTLEYEYRRRHPNGHFFDRDTLRFFGERISEMHVLKGTVQIKDCNGETRECYMLSSRQHKHPLGPRRVYHYFDANTYEHVIT